MTPKPQKSCNPDASLEAKGTTEWRRKLAVMRQAESWMFGTNICQYVKEKLNLYKTDNFSLFQI